ncbi:hypothetical protein CYY_001293, partial [Polysphondylium violaceum]
YLSYSHYQPVCTNLKYIQHYMNKQNELQQHIFQSNPLSTTTSALSSTADIGHTTIDTSVPSTTTTTTDTSSSSSTTTTTTTAMEVEMDRANSKYQPNLSQPIHSENSPQFTNDTAASSSSNSMQIDNPTTIGITPNGNHINNNNNNNSIKESSNNNKLTLKRKKELIKLMGLESNNDDDDENLTIKPTTNPIYNLKPSLFIHLYPTIGYTLDNINKNKVYSYNEKNSKEFLNSISQGRLLPDLIQILDEIKSSNYYQGCIVVDIKDYRGFLSSENALTNIQQQQQQQQQKINGRSELSTSTSSTSSKSKSKSNHNNNNNNNSNNNNSNNERNFTSEQLQLFKEYIEKRVLLKPDMESVLLDIKNRISLNQDLILNDYIKQQEKQEKEEEKQENLDPMDNIFDETMLEFEEKYLLAIEPSLELDPDLDVFFNNLETNQNQQYQQRLLNFKRLKTIHHEPLSPYQQQQQVQYQVNQNCFNELPFSKKKTNYFNNMPAKIPNSLKHFNPYTAPSLLSTINPQNLSPETLDSISINNNNLDNNNNKSRNIDNSNNNNSDKNDFLLFKLLGSNQKWDNERRSTLKFYNTDFKDFKSYPYSFQNNNNNNNNIFVNNSSNDNVNNNNNNNNNKKQPEPPFKNGVLPTKQISHDQLKDRVIQYYSTSNLTVLTYEINLKSGSYELLQYITEHPTFYQTIVNLKNLRSHPQYNTNPQYLPMVQKFLSNLNKNVATLTQTLNPELSFIYDTPLPQPLYNSSMIGSYSNALFFLNHLKHSLENSGTYVLVYDSISPKVISTQAVETRKRIEQKLLALNPSLSQTAILISVPAAKPAAATTTTTTSTNIPPSTSSSSASSSAPTTASTTTTTTTTNTNNQTQSITTTTTIQPPTLINSIPLNSNTITTPTTVAPPLIQPTLAPSQIVNPQPTMINPSQSPQQFLELIKSKKMTLSNHMQQGQQQYAMYQKNLALYEQQNPQPVAQIQQTKSIMGNISNQLLVLKNQFQQLLTQEQQILQQLNNNNLGTTTTNINNNNNNTTPMNSTLNAQPLRVINPPTIAK